jgi:hypothetical protein
VSDEARETFAIDSLEGSSSVKGAFLVSDEQEAPLSIEIEPLDLVLRFDSRRFH